MCTLHILSPSMWKQLYPRRMNDGSCGFMKVDGVAARGKMQAACAYIHIYVRMRAYIYSSSYAGWLTFLLSEKEVFALA